LQSTLHDILEQLSQKRKKDYEKNKDREGVPDPSQDPRRA